MTESMLDRWARTVDERESLRSFLLWAGSRGMGLGVWSETGRMLRPSVEGWDRTFDRYFEIDRSQLDRERRALLAQTEVRQELGQIDDEERAELRAGAL